ncbi:MAG: translation initiation factor IF-2 [Bacteroidetes bacterium GWA2_31_9]|nr:MAG: translation initiation factor IF-2 [Bacteroidetes bacterium GWA2_31_9]
MSKGEIRRLSKVAKEFNVGISTIVEFLHKKGVEVDSNPNTKITEDTFEILIKEYSSEIYVKKESEKISLKAPREKNESVTIEDIVIENNVDDEPETEKELIIKDVSSNSNYIDSVEDTKKKEEAKKPELKILGKIDLSAPKRKTPEKVTEKVAEKSPEKAPEKTVEPVVEKKEKVKAEKPVEKIIEPEKVEKEVEQIEEKAVEEINEISTIITDDIDIKVVGRIDLSTINQKTRPDRKSKEQKDTERKEKETVRKDAVKKRHEDDKIIKPKETIESVPVKKLNVRRPDENFIKTNVDKLSGPTVVGKIALNQKEKQEGNNSNDFSKKKKRKRISKENERVNVSTEKDKKVPIKANVVTKDLKWKKGKKSYRADVDTEEVDKQIKDTFSLLSKTGKSKASKHRRDKRDAVSQKMQDEMDRMDGQKHVLSVTEFVTVNEIASLMNVPVTQIIATCMNLGLFVSINQRLDSDTITVVADEFGFTVEFVTVETQESIEEVEEDESVLEHRPPIVTVMGHVDHGKTKLLDYIRSANVVAGEAGGITQHIGAYNVTLDNGKKITFLDTPGHEAFTAMRARGAQVTDIAIIVVAADDGVMPQTREAINHAQAAGVPLIIAINKIDKQGANPEKIKEELANMNILVEDWGGKFQSQEIAAKPGTNIDLLLEKVLLEAEMLDLKANPNKFAIGTVVESSLDKGRGYVSTLLVKAGTLKIGDVVLAGSYYGRVKAMYNERNQKVDEAGPSCPLLILGLNGAPQAGDKFNVLASEKEAKELANKREQLQREQGLKTQRHITLDEIGRRLSVGNFKELNVIVKGDVDGSIEALSDSLIKLSTEQVQINIIHKAVGQISESDVMLASASNAIIIGFQVRPSVSARKIAEKEAIEIRLYSIIYDAIEEVKLAMEGMLSPEIREEIIGAAEIREVFKIDKVGTIAGCLVTDGKIVRSAKVRLIRDGIVIYSGDLGSLKRFKDDAKDVHSGLECGLNIHNFNDIKVGDIVEAFTETEVKKKL